MPPWALRILAVLVTGVSMIGSTTYTLAHPKNPNAPLQPPVAEKQGPVAEPEPTPVATLPFRTLAPTVPPTPTVAPTTAAPTTAAPTATARASATVAGTVAAARPSTSPTATPRPATPTPTLRPTPVPQITLAAGVRATSLPKVTYTHSS